MQPNSFMFTHYCHYFLSTYYSYTETDTYIKYILTTLVIGAIKQIKLLTYPEDSNPF